jgi:murein DD-endopeptidase MepM/ murein hydrolase activator NlpD
MKVFLFAIFLSFSALAAPAKIKHIKDKLNSQSGVIVKLGAEIKTLEKDLNVKNDLYIKKLESLKKYQTKVDDLMQELKLGQDVIYQEKEKLKRAAQAYIMEKNDQEDDNALISKVLLERSMKSKMSKLNGLKRENQRLVDIISQYSKELTQIQNEQSTLYELIISLESRKKDISQKYISTLETKNVLEEKLENELAQNKAKKSVKVSDFNLDIDFNIILPLKKFSKYQGGKEGVTFKYDSVEPLIACANGRVEYSGELASYGKVIILDHGKDIRSVILGEISSKVQKGQEVRQGQIIGYTIAKPGIKKSLYYEIRKKNKVQNTLAWLKKTNNNLL